MPTFGRCIFGADLWGGPASSSSVATERDRFFLRVEDGNGYVQAHLGKWGSGQWRRKAIGIPEIEFTYPMGTDEEAYFTFPYQIVLHDVDGTVLQRFHLAQRTKTIGRDGAARWKILGKGLIAQLGRERVAAYTASGMTVEDFVWYLIANYQNNGVIDAITFGSCDAVIGAMSADTTLENVSVLAAFEDLRERVGGYYYVDADGAFHWARFPRGAASREFRVGKDLAEMSVTEDFETIATRVTAYGQGLDNDTRPSYTADGATQATYGVIHEVMGNTNVRSAAEVQALAEGAAERLAVPLKEYTIGVIDLSKLGGRLDYSHETIDVPGRVNVVHDVLDETITTLVLAATHDLASPVDVRVEVGNPAALEATGEETPDEGCQTPQTAATVADMIAGLIEDVEDITVRDPGVNETTMTGIDADGNLTDLSNVAWQEGEYGNFESMLNGLIDPSAVLDDAEEITWWDLDAGAGNLDEALFDIIGGAVDAGSEIPWWDATNDIGTLDDLVADAINAGVVAGGSTLTEAIESVAGTSDQVATNTADITDNVTAIATNASDIDDLEASLPTAADDDPEPVTSAEGDKGSASTEYALEDHTHQGQPFVSVDEYDDLESADDGTFAYVEDEDTFYQRAGGAWRPVAVRIVDTAEDIVAGDPDGSITYVEGTDEHYLHQNGAQNIVMSFHGEVTEFPALPSDGLHVVYHKTGGGDTEPGYFFAGPNSTAWTSMDYTTTKTGAAGT